MSFHRYATIHHRQLMHPFRGRSARRSRRRRPAGGARFARSPDPARMRFDLRSFPMLSHVKSPAIKTHWNCFPNRPLVFDGRRIKMKAQCARPRARPHAHPHRHTHAHARTHARTHAHAGAGAGAHADAHAQARSPARPRAHARVPSRAGSAHVYIGVCYSVARRPESTHSRSASSSLSW